jgi:hypothetical protein
MARQAAAQSAYLAKDIKTLTDWLRQDVLELAGPALATRQELYDFVTAELRAREHLDKKRIGKVRVALQNRRNDLLAFAGVLDRKLESIAQENDVCMYLVRQACVLQRKPTTSSLYWQGWCRLCSEMGDKCHVVFESVMQAGHGRDTALQLYGRELEFQAAQLFHAASPARRGVPELAAILPESPHVSTQPRARTCWEKSQAIDDRLRAPALADDAGLWSAAAAAKLIRCRSTGLPPFHRTEPEIPNSCGRHWRACVTRKRP